MSANILILLVSAIGLIFLNIIALKKVAKQPKQSFSIPMEEPADALPPDTLRGVLSACFSLAPTHSAAKMAMTIKRKYGLKIPTARAIVLGLSRGIDAALRCHNGFEHHQNARTAMFALKRKIGELELKEIDREQLGRILDRLHEELDQIQLHY